MGTIIRYSYKEMIRKKIFLITVVLTIAFLALYGFGVYEINKEIMAHTSNMQDASTMMMRSAQSIFYISFGLYFSYMLVAFLIIFAASGIISSDIENGTIQTVLTRPISREKYLFGRFMGYFLLVFLYSIFVFLSIILINKFFGISLNLKTINIIKSILIFSIIPITLLSITTYFSTKISTLGTGIIVIILMGLSMVGGMIEEVGYVISTQSQVGDRLIKVGIITSLVIPVDNIYREASRQLFGEGLLAFSSFNPFSGTSTPSIFMKIYWFLYILIFIFLALKSFRKKDI